MTAITISDDRVKTRTVWSDWLLTAAVVALVSSPALFSKSGFATDFTNHLWLSDVAGKNLWAAGHPTFFLNATGNGSATNLTSPAPIGVFSPFFAFYGGTLYAVVGAIAQLLGDPLAAYVGFIVFMIASCYRGTLLLARQAGLSTWWSQLPALVVVTSAYFVTDIYGRGAWPEFVAGAAIAPMLASASAVVKSSPLGTRAMVGLVFYTMLLTGSHNVTMIWGATFSCLAVLFLWVSVGFSMRLPWRRIVVAVVLVAIGCGLNAWFLLPDVRFNGFIQAGSFDKGISAMFLDTPGVLLFPFRTVPSASGTPALFVQAPVWMLAWTLITASVLLTRRKTGSGLWRAWLPCAGLIAVVLVLICVAPVWKVIPFPWDTIQFPYRLCTYLVYAGAAAVAISALALQRAWGRIHMVTRISLGGALAIAVVATVALCVWQLWVPNALQGTSFTNRGHALAQTVSAPMSWYDPGLYADSSAQVVVAPSGRALIINPADVHGDTFSGWVDPPAGMAPIQTNIAGGAYLVKLTGLVRDGRSERGFAVVRREHPGKGRVYVTIATAQNGTVVGGWVISLVALFLVLMIVGWGVLRRARNAARRRGGRQSPGIRLQMVRR
ncbi:MAG TPA: hypothetical protein VHV75_15565 [Solirubrobacteraceae bacterium]|nr:hypothetical protein [Solirubrobacteraceae bacterium]